MARTKVFGKEKFNTPEAKAAIERRRIMHILRQPTSLEDNRPAIDSDSESEPDMDFLDEMNEGVSITMLAQFVPDLNKAILLYRHWQIKRVLIDGQKRQKRERVEEKMRLRELSKWERTGKRLRRLSDGRTAPTHGSNENEN